MYGNTKRVGKFHHLVQVFGLEKRTVAYAMNSLSLNSQSGVEVPKYFPRYTFFDYI